jgi:hypothetical protein
VEKGVVRLQPRMLRTVVTPDSGGGAGAGSLRTLGASPAHIWILNF